MTERGDEPAPSATASDPSSHSISSALTSTRAPIALGDAYFDYVEDHIIEMIVRFVLDDPELWTAHGDIVFNRTLNSFPRVCRRFRNLVASQQFWQDLDLDIAGVAAKFTALTEIPTNKFVELFRTSGRFRKYTHLSGKDLPAWLAAFLATEMPSLRVLSMLESEQYAYYIESPDGDPELRPIMFDDVIAILAARNRLCSLELCGNGCGVALERPHDFGELMGLSCGSVTLENITAPRLERLTVRSNALHSAALFLARYPKLAELTIIDAGPALNLRAMPKLPSLRALTLSCRGIEFDAGDLVRIAGSAERVSFTGEITSQLLWAIWNLTNLHSLHIGCTAGTANLTLPRGIDSTAEPLDDLSLSNLRFDPMQLFGTRRCRNLRRLTLDRCRFPALAGTALRNLAYFSDAHTQNPAFTAAVIDSAKGLRELRLCPDTDMELNDMLTDPHPEDPAVSEGVRNSSVTRMTLQITPSFGRIPDPRDGFPSLETLRIDAEMGEYTMDAIVDTFRCIAGFTVRDSAGQVPTIFVRVVPERTARTDEALSELIRVIKPTWTALSVVLIFP